MRYYLPLALLFFLCAVSCYQDNTHTATKNNDKNDSLKASTNSRLDSLYINLADSSYEVRQSMIEKAWQTLMPQVPKMNVKSLNSPFYMRMEGFFNGHPAILNLSFGHFAYDGDWVLEGTLYDYAENIMYKGWTRTSDTLSYMPFSIEDNITNQEFEFRGGLKGNIFSGIALNCSTLQHTTFEFKEKYNDSSYSYDISECYMNIPYTGAPPREQPDRAFSIILAHSNTVMKPENKANIYHFLKDSLKHNSDCNTIWNDFKKRANSELSETFKNEGFARNSEYSSVIKKNIVWNDDNLLVLNKYFWDNTAIISYGDQDLAFITYDLSNQKQLHWSEVFKMEVLNPDHNRMEKAILEYLEWEKDDLNANISEGFTSKGFYIVAPGNHGYYIRPIFIPYEVVSDFLKDDFKKRYWKK